MNKNDFCALIKSVMNDDNGISEKSFEILYDCYAKYFKEEEEVKDIIQRVKATDGRFYLP